MIKEFAVEPEVMATWAHFQSLFEDFGVGKGRLISEYPGKWRQMVYELAPRLSGEIKGYSIRSKISAQRHKLIPGRSRCYDPDPRKDWLVNAEARMEDTPFDGIVARENPRRHGAVFVAGEIERDEPPWRTSTQSKVERPASALANCAGLLLSVAIEIVLVDPNFDATESRFREPLAAIFQAPSQCKRWKPCEVHTIKPDVFVRDVHEINYSRHLAGVVPTGTTLRVHFWSQRMGGETMHPRFLLTEFGGLHYDYGLDRGRDPGEKTIVTLLDHSLFLQIRADYTCPSPTFDITPDCIIDVRGRG